MADEIEARHGEISGTEEQATLLQGTSSEQQQHVSLTSATSEDLAITRRERLANLAKTEAETARIAVETAEMRSRLVSGRLQAIAEERELLRRNGAYDEARHGQWFRDRMLAAAQTDPLRLLTDGSSTGEGGLTLWTVAHRVQALGLRFRSTRPGERDRAQALGVHVAQEFRRRNGGQDPPKIFRGDAPTVVGGSNVAPNGYSSHDCEQYIDGVIRRWIAEDATPTQQEIRNFLSKN